MKIEKDKKDYSFKELRALTQTPEAKESFKRIEERNLPFVMGWVGGVRAIGKVAKKLLSKGKRPMIGLGWLTWIGWIRNKVLEAEDALKQDVDKPSVVLKDKNLKDADEVIKDTSKVIKDVDKSKKDKDVAKRVVVSGVSTKDPYVNWKAADIEWSTRPEWVQATEPVMLPWTTKKISNLDKWTDLIKSYTEYKWVPAGEWQVTKSNVADFFQRMKKMPKWDVNKFIERYKSRKTE